ncbi:MAG TPA: AzlD domain-containing protein [Acetobacteraceae bacterium]|nr:AzlD domain-containing protein [Acetobacteraceae bacterium]
MTLDPWVFATILAMSLATYATRAGGYLLFRAIRPSEGVRRLLSYIPGTLFMAYVAPALAEGALPQWAGAAGAVAIMLATRQMSAAIFGGTAVAWLVWSWT